MGDDVVTLNQSRVPQAAVSPEFKTCQALWVWIAGLFYCFVFLPVGLLPGLRATCQADSNIKQ